MTLTNNITNQLVSNQFTHETYHPPSHPSNLGPWSTLLFTHTHFAPKPSFNVKSVLMSPTYNIRSVFKYSTCFSLLPTSKTLCLDYPTQSFYLSKSSWLQHVVVFYLSLYPIGYFSSYVVLQVLIRSTRAPLLDLLLVSSSLIRISTHSPTRYFLVWEHGTTPNLTIFGAFLARNNSHALLSTHLHTLDCVITSPTVEPLFLVIHSNISFYFFFKPSCANSTKSVDLRYI